MWSLGFNQSCGYLLCFISSMDMQCIVQQIFNLLPFLSHFVRVIRLSQTGCIYKVKLSSDNITLIKWIKIDHILLKWSWLTVRELFIDKYIHKLTLTIYQELQEYSVSSLWTFLKKSNHQKALKYCLLKNKHNSWAEGLRW